MNITLRQINAFLAVADLRSFTRAGGILNISQSAVSSLIHELEGQIGVALFDRTSRNVTLSNEGEGFLPVARKASEEFDQVETFARDLHKQRSGYVCVAGAPMVCGSVLPVVIAAFSDAAPGIHVELKDLHISRVQRMVIERETDLAIGPQWPPEPEILMEHLFSTRTYLMCRPDHPLAGKSISLKQLKHESVIVAARATLGHLSPDILSSGGVRVEREVNHMSTAFALAAAGRGTVLNSEYCMRMGAAFGLVAIPLVNPAVFQNIMIYTGKSRVLSPAALIFLSFLREFMRKNDPNEMENQYPLPSPTPGFLPAAGRTGPAVQNTDTPPGW